MLNGLYVRAGSRSEECFFDDGGEVSELEQPDFAVDIGGRISRADLYGGLKDDGAVVVVLVDVVDCYSGNSLAGSNDGFVDFYAVHAFSSEFRKEGRMDVDYPAAITVDQRGRYHEEKSGEDDDVDGFSVEYADQ